MTMIVVAKINGEKVEKEISTYYINHHDPYDGSWKDEREVWKYWDAATGFLQSTPEAKTEDIVAIFDIEYKEYEDEDGDTAYDYDNPVGRKLLWGGYENPEANGIDVYLNAYEYTQGYGGPQEGGWWYDIWTPMNGESLKFRHTGPATDNISEIYSSRRDEMLKRIEEELGYHRSASSAAGDGFDVKVHIEFHPPESGNNYSPWC